MVRYTVSLPPKYLEKIQKLKARLGIESNSEVVRRAIDEFASRYGLEVVEEADTP